MDAMMHRITAQQSTESIGFTGQRLPEDVG